MADVLIVSDGRSEIFSLLSELRRNRSVDAITVLRVASPTQVEPSINSVYGLNLSEEFYEGQIRDRVIEAGECLECFELLIAKTKKDEEMSVMVGALPPYHLRFSVYSMPSWIYLGRGLRPPDWRREMDRRPGGLSDAPSRLLTRFPATWRAVPGRTPSPMETRQQIMDGYSPFQRSRSFRGEHWQTAERRANPRARQLSWGHWWRSCGRHALKYQRWCAHMRLHEGWLGCFFAAVIGITEGDLEPDPETSGNTPKNYGLI